MVRASPLRASGFPAAAKSQNPFLADLNRVWLTCFHISQEQEEREEKKRKKDLSFLSNKELWKSPICCVLTKISCVCGTACQLSLLSLHTLREPGLLNRELFSLHTDHILHGEWQNPPAALEGDLRTGNICCGSHLLRLARPLGCRLLICTSESVSLHTRDLRDNEGFVPRVHFLDCTKTTQTERKSPLDFFFFFF